MNRYSKLFASTLLLILFSNYHSSMAQQSIQPDSISVMSYNIRYDNPDDSLNSWVYRKEKLVNLVKFYDPDFLGIQEGLDQQVRYLTENLSGREFIGNGRTDGEKEGEYSAIYYNSGRFALVSGTDSTMWLSPTPGVPGKGWDAALPRIVTWGKFRSKINGKEFYVFNTHFDHIGDTARAESAKLILETIQKVTKGMPVVLMGDFNVPEVRKPYKILTGYFLKDAWYASKLPPIGPEFTYAGFDLYDSSARGARIDYIFVNNSFDVNKIATISSFKHEAFLSDHLPVYSELSWNKQNQ